MRKIALAIHGGVGTDVRTIKANIAENEAGLIEALEAGFTLLKKGRSALSAVEAAVMKLEDNPIFNAGRGSALNRNGEVEMDASIMDGKTLKAGAVSMVRSVKNPIYLARHIMTKTKHVFLSGYGALEVANLHNIKLEPDDYFVTRHQYEAFQKYTAALASKRAVKKNRHGTVGAVALDKDGNLAAATSTGGTDFTLPGRIGDSCVIGAGCYANNKTCAVSGTGEGEYLITRVVGHTISMLVELKHLPIQKACDVVIFKRTPTPKQDMGVIAIDRHGKFGFSFNTSVMRRACIDSNGDRIIRFFPD